MFDKNFFTKFNKIYLNTNMPYIYYYNNEPEYVFCNLINSKWQLFHWNKELNTAERIYTGFTFYGEVDPYIWVNKKINLSCNIIINNTNPQKLIYSENIKNLTDPKNKFVDIGYFRCICYN